jgi:hypothetical protein
MDISRYFQLVGAGSTDLFLWLEGFADFAGFGATCGKFLTLFGSINEWGIGRINNPCAHTRLTIWQAEKARNPPELLLNPKWSVLLSNCRVQPNVWHSFTRKRFVSMTVIILGCQKQSGDTHSASVKPIVTRCIWISCPWSTQNRKWHLMTPWHLGRVVF